MPHSGLAGQRHGAEGACLAHRGLGALPEGNVDQNSEEEQVADQRHGLPCPLVWTSLHGATGTMVQQELGFGSSHLSQHV